MLLRDILPRMLLGEDVAAQYPAADDAGVGLLCDTLLRTLLVWGCCCVIKGSRFWTPYFLRPNGCCCAMPCCGRCWVRMSLRNTLLGTMLVWGCCAIPCCGRCWCEDGAARYRAADGAGVRMVLRDTVLRTVLVWGCCCAIPCCGRCWCEDGAARYRAADGAGVRMAPLILCM